MCKKSVFLPAKKLKDMENFAAIDFETANNALSSICSVGIVIVKEGSIADHFYSLVKPQPWEFNYWNIKVHGIHASDVKDAPSFPEVWAKVVPLVGDLPFVAHNKSFDETCLKQVFQMYKLPYPNYKFYCTYNTARKKLKTEVHDYKLPTVAAYCGYQLANHHHALADAEACAVIAQRIL